MDGFDLRYNTDMGRTLRERFDAKVSPPDKHSCWLWTGATIRGYGAIQRGRRGDGVAYAHRVSHEFHIGPIPNGLLVLHRCDVPACVNPAHLFLGTDANNMADKIGKGRQPRGSSMPTAKLTETTVSEARRLFATGGFTKRALARRFRIDETNMRRVLSGESWAHVS